MMAVLASMLLPALNSARDKAKSIYCISNQKQIFSGVIMYSDDLDGWLPVSGIYGEWRLQVLPYIYNRGVSVWDADTISLICTPGSIFWCPSYKDPATVTRTSTSYWSGYGWNWSQVGYQLTYSGSLAGRFPCKLNEISVPSECILFADTSDYYNLSSGLYFVYPPTSSVSRPNNQRHSKGMNSTFADGHVIWASEADYISHSGSTNSWYNRKK